MQHNKTFKSLVGPALIILSASVFSCNNDKKTETTTTDTSAVVTPPVVVKDTMKVLKDTIKDTFTNHKTEQTPPPKN